MNKKTYINPEMEIVKINSVQLLAGSMDKVGEISEPLSPEFEPDTNMFGF